MKRRTKPVGRSSPAHKQLRKLNVMVRLIEEKGLIKCHFCQKPIEDLMRGVEHHLNHDHSNDEVGNRVPMHKSCHVSYHQEDRKKRKEAENED